MKKKRASRNNKQETTSYLRPKTGRLHNRTTPGDDDFDDDVVVVDGESRLVRAVFFFLVGEERERGAWKSTSENV